MPLLSNVAVVVPDLPVVVPPTARNIIHNLPPWIVRAIRIVLVDAHYENSIYGPINAYLNTIFPVGRQFQVKPQPVVRRVIDDDEQDAANTSIGSWGALHESRDLPGQEAEILIPDFLVSKVLNPNGQTRTERIVAAMEIKRDGERPGTAQIQMIRYMYRLADQPTRVNDLQGWLILGRKAIKYTLGEDGTVDNGQEFDILDNDRMTADLARIAIQNWM